MSSLSPFEYLITKIGKYWFGEKKELHEISYQQLSIFDDADKKEIENIKKKYKVVKVEFLDPILLNVKINKDDYFQHRPIEKKILHDMLKYYTKTDEHTNAIIGKQTMYFCNEKHKICICNEFAENFQKALLGSNFQRRTYISWMKYTTDKW